MKTYRQLAIFFVVILTGSLALTEEKPHFFTGKANKITVEIKIVADSLNTLQASVVVESGTNARDLMERLFQIEYADRDKKFVKGIAGFHTRRLKREFWALEVDGKFSEVGIAEVILHKDTKILWMLKEY